MVQWIAIAKKSVEKVLKKCKRKERLNNEKRVKWIEMKKERKNKRKDIERKKRNKKKKRKRKGKKAAGANRNG